ncbi:MAG: hypothetical protein ACLFOY_16540 [Desulfatibacillaceae bacterium]
MAARKEGFSGECRPTLIGSLPVSDHDEAVHLIRDHVPEIPLWVQLPTYPREGMVAQFLPGMPGLVESEHKTYIDTSSDRFEQEYLEFYEEYLAVSEEGADLMASRFAFDEDLAPGFFTLLEHLSDWPVPLAAIKGQVTGPFTMTTSVKDQNGRDLLFDDRLRDAMVKMMAMKARWQVRKLRETGAPVILFLDEPALAGFGTSAYITVTKDDVTAMLAEVMESVAEEGGYVGVHICANSDWSLVLDSAADFVSFDAYSFFDKFVLFDKGLHGFLERGGNIAWGIVPTSEPDAINSESVDSLTRIFFEQAATLEKLGVDKATIYNQTVITPACGTGSLDVPTSKRVLELTRGVSDRVRAEFFQGV